jgi:ADP-ribose pyrophosphatase YjhB (NUDIX family)
MPNLQPRITAANGRRQFACSAAGVLAFIVDDQERILLLSHPRRAGMWEVVNGALEAEETVLVGVLREVREEVGPTARVRPLGTVHTWTFRYDDTVQYMISIGYLLAYEGGAIEPGDDMLGSQYRWWRLEEVAAAHVQLIVPRDQKWLLGRAIELYRLWKDQQAVLEPAPDLAAGTKDTL